MGENSPLRSYFEDIWPDSNRPPFPVHIDRRMATLLGDEPIEYADNGLSSGDGNLYSGNVVAVTRTRFVMAAATDSPVRIDLRFRTRELNDQNTATVMTWSRAQLAAIEVTGPDASWTPALELADGLPDGARVTIRFAADDLPTLELPMTKRVNDTQLMQLSEVLSSLCDDLEPAKRR